MIDFVKPQGSNKNLQAADDAMDGPVEQLSLFHPHDHSHSHNHEHDHSNPRSLDITKSNSLNQKAWEDELQEAKHKPWNSTVQGRGMIRLFSRGVLGATFFALGTRISRDGLVGYNQLEKPSAFNIPQNIAYTIDRFVGRPLEKVMGKEFVTFRPTRMHKNSQGWHQGVSLGQETVGLTFDFASMSIGDAMGRDIANAVDPNIKQNWVDKNGRIDYTQVAKNVGYNSWKYLTYNQGEDWAVSLPYVFFARWQRNAINKISPGFGYDNDRRLNGGSYKVDDHGKVVGTFGLEGALDLQSRFTVYNIGTVMFRETYTAMGNRLKDWYESGFQLPTAPKTTADTANSITGYIGKTIRWAARDIVKGALYMTPAVPAFWMFRTPQTKFKATFIHPEKGAIAYRSGPEKYHIDFVHAHEVKRSSNKYVDPNTRQKFTGYNDTFFARHEGTDWSHGANIPNPITPYMSVLQPDGRPLKKYPSYDKTYGTFDALVNPIGKINNDMRKMVHYPIGKAKEHLGIDLDTQKIRAKHFTDDVVNASFAYTPYFFMKSDVMAAQWDTGKMDMAIERAIDGVTSFKPSEVKEGVSEIWNTMWQKPFSDPAREIEAQRRVCNDKSPPDGQTFNENQRCFDEALQDISLHSSYHQKADTKKFVERLQDSKNRSKNLLDGFRKDVAEPFAGSMKSKTRDDDSANSSFSKRERIRQAQNRDDFPDIGTTVH